MYDTIAARQANRDRIARETEEFLRNGGTIEVDVYDQEVAMERARKALKGDNWELKETHNEEDSV